MLQENTIKLANLHINLCCACIVTDKKTFRKTFEKVDFCIKWINQNFSLQKKIKKLRFFSIEKK